MAVEEMSEVLVDCPAGCRTRNARKKAKRKKIGGEEAKGLKGCSLRAEIYDRHTHTHTRDVSMSAEVTGDYGFITPINDEDMCVYLKTLYLLYIACLMI